MGKSLRIVEFLLSSQLSSTLRNSYLRTVAAKLLWGRHSAVKWTQTSAWLSRVRLGFMSMSRSSIKCLDRPSSPIYQFVNLNQPGRGNRCSRQQSTSHPSAVRLVICSRSKLPKNSWLILSPSNLSWLCWFGWLLLILPCFTCSSHIEMSSFLCKWWICGRRPNDREGEGRSRKRPGWPRSEIWRDWIQRYRLRRRGKPGPRSRLILLASSWRRTPRERKYRLLGNIIGMRRPHRSS